MDIDDYDATPSKRRRTLGSEYSAAHLSSNEDALPPLPASSQEPTQHTNSATTEKELNSQPAAQPLTPDQLEHAQNELLSFCNRLNLDAQSQQLSWQLLQTYYQKYNDTADFKYYACASIWIVSRMLSKQSRDRGDQILGNGLALSQVLLGINCNALDFFHKLKEFASRCPLDSDLAQYLEIEVQCAQVDFNALSMMYMRYNQLFQTFFRFVASSKPTREDEVFALDMYRFGWYLFLFCKEKLVPDNHLNVSNYALVLLCTLRFMTVHSPKEFRKTLEDVKKRLLYTPDMDPADAEKVWTVDCKIVFSTICQKWNVNDLTENEPVFFNCIQKEIIEKKVLELEGISHDAEFNYPVIQGAFQLSNRGLLAKNLERLSQEYHMILHGATGRYDGRQFIKKFSNNGTPRRISATPRTCFKTPAARNLTAELQRASALDNAMQSTPLTAKNLPCRQPAIAAVENDYAVAEKLQHILSNLSDGPSNTLMAYLNACSPATAISVVSRAQKCLVYFTNMDPTSEATWKLALRFYFKILELMLRGEEARLGSKRPDFSTLLNDSKFHRSLLACSMDILRFCFKIKSISFEHILRALEVEPFDFCSIIDVCIRYDGKLLNWNLVKRLKELEERILEREVWQCDYPIYQELKNETSTGNDALFSPRKALHYVTAKSSASRPDAVQEGPLMPLITIPGQESTTALELFFRKVYRLANLRVQNLCKEIGISEGIMAKIWHVLVEVFLNEHNWRLLYKRHVDTVILCSIYGVARMYNVEISFHDIIVHYKSQPQCTYDLYKRIPMPNGAFADIVTFYNSVFLKRTKTYIHEVKTVDERISAPSMVSSAHPMPPLRELMSPRRFPQVSNILGSPLGKGAMTPRTLRLYNPGERIAVNEPQPEKLKSARKLDFSNQ